MDEISKNEILKQINNENFNSLKYLKAEYDEFKNILKNQIPKPLDFIKYEDAPNFYKYSRLQKSYLDFLIKMKDELFSVTEEEKIIIRELERFLPIKRVHEFAIIHELIVKNKPLTKNELIYSIGKYIEIININDSLENIYHAMRYLNGDFFDSVDLKRCPKLFNLNNSIIEKTELFDTVLKNDNIKNYILEILDYGLLKYKEVFGLKDYGFPFFKLYENYFMKDVALLCNYDKKHSAFRGSGDLLLQKIAKII